MKTFEEAVKEYQTANGKDPELSQMIDLYRRYRSGLKEYGWQSFTEFLNWIR